MKHNADYGVVERRPVPEHGAGPRLFRRKCQAGHPGLTDADRHGQELINEGREIFLRPMQRS